jgi:tetratricopeptide (TPR) repeat protein
MADIFLSYASEDRPRVAPLARALADAGFTLWWDRDIAPGADFAETIDREIKAAKAVVVCWTEAASRSQWVRDEATFGRRHRILIPLLLSGDEPPLGFQQVQSIEFRNWRGDPLAPAFATLCAAAREMAARAGDAPAAPPAKPRLSVRIRSFWSRRRAPLLALAALVVGAAIALAYVDSRKPAAPQIAMGAIEIAPFVARPEDAARGARAAAYAEAFRHRLIELGVPIAAAGEMRRATPEMILRGDLSAEGGGEFLTARLDDRRTGVTLWSIRRAPSPGAAVEANIAARALQCALRRRDPNGEARIFGLWLKACGAFPVDWSAHYAAAKALYDAVPDNANAAGYFAFATAVYASAVAQSVAEKDKNQRQAARLAEAALKTDPGNPDALFARADAIGEHRFWEQEPLFRDALDADPDFAAANARYSFLLGDVGRIRESIDYNLRAWHLALGGTPGWRVARLLFATGDFPAGKQIYDQLRILNPSASSHELLTHVWYGDPALAQRMLAERKDSPELASREVACYERTLAARRGEQVDSEALAEDCRPLGHIFLPRFLVIAGDVDGAFREIELYLHDPVQGMPQLFYPEMRPLQRDQRFWPLANKLGLVDYWLDTDQWPDFCAEPDLPFDCREKATAARDAGPTVEASNP